MGGSKILNMEVISCPRTVQGIVIGSVNLHARCLPERNFEDVRDQMRLEPMMFAEMNRKLSFRITSEDARRNRNAAIS